jgi:ATP-dependent helicase IRC3
MVLRNYQREALEAIRAADRAGDRKLLVALPTGTGKTRVASSLPDYIDLRPWEVLAFCVASEELAFQAVEDLQACNPDLQVTLEKAEFRGDVDADIVVASIDTLARSPERLARLAALPLRVVFLDECHGAVSPKYMKVLKALRVLKGEDDCDPNVLLIGLTATPRRHDGLALERIFDRIVYRRGIREMVAEGWIAEPIAYRVEAGLDLDDVQVRQGDFATGELRQKVNTPRINALVVQKYLEYGAGLPFIGFSVDIAHSNDLAATFRHHGIQCEAISSDTPKAERKEAIRAHRNMELPGLISCQALLVGFDSPPATVALFVRPTCSGLLYTQAVGRVLRRYPAPEAAASHTGYVKRNGIIVDFTGASTKHRLYTAATLYGLNPQFDFNGASISKTMEHLESLSAKNPTLDISVYAGLADVEAAAVSVDLWKPAPIPKLAKSCSKFLWAQAGENTYRLSAPGMTVTIEQNLLGEYEVSRRVGKAEPDARLVFTEPEDGFAYADSLVPDEAVTLIRANARWRKDPPKKGQCVALWRRDPIVHQRFSSGEAFHRYAVYQFEQGNQGMSKGSISMRIDLTKYAKERTAHI